MSDHVNNWIVLFVALPMATAVLTTLLRGHVLVQRVLGLLSLVTLAVAGITLCATLPADTNLFFSPVGLWDPPFGIAIVFDGLSGILLTIVACVAIGCLIDSFSSVPRHLELGWFHPLFHLLVMGVNFSFLTGDLFNLFVAFEIMLMASYALMTLGGGADQIKQAYKYVLLNLLGSTIFVLSAGLMYGMMGTLNYADLARLVHEAHVSGRPLPSGFNATALMLMLVFAIKGAMFPVWFWLPDSYWTLPSSIGAMFAGLLSKVGVYAILRLYPMFLSGPGHTGTSIDTILPIAAGATMLVAIFGAVGSHSVRRLVCWVLISHVGYLIFGVLMLRDASFSATLYYMSQEMLVIAGLFLVAGLIERVAGTDDLHKLGGLYRRAPLLAGITFVLLLSLTGMPPFAGFFAKTLLLREGLASGHWWLVGATLTTATITLIAALRIWCHAFWMPARGATAPPEGAHWGAPPLSRFACAGAGGLALVGVAFGLLAPVTMSFTANATEGLAEPARYVDAILGDGVWSAMTDGAVASSPTGQEGIIP